MALFQFSTSISTTVSELADKLTSWQDSGASISEIAISNINDISFLINDKYCNVKYSMSSSQNANYYWFLCDSVGYETLIVLCDSPIVNENGYKGSFGNALYNAIYFLHNGRLVRNPQIDEPICSQFNIPNGWSSLDTDSTILTKCTYNDGINLTTGTNQIADKLYISTNLSSVGYKTKIVTGAKEFICIGGFFYLEYNNSISNLSKYRPLLKDAISETFPWCRYSLKRIYDTQNKYYWTTFKDFEIGRNGKEIVIKNGYYHGEQRNANSSIIFNSTDIHNKTFYFVMSLKDWYSAIGSKFTNLIGTCDSDDNPETSNESNFRRSISLSPYPQGYITTTGYSYYENGNSVASSSDSIKASETESILYNLSYNKKIIIAMKISDRIDRYNYDYNATFYINNSNNYFYGREQNFAGRGTKKRIYIGTINNSDYLPNIYIDYLCCCDAYHTNEQIDKNIQKLAKIFEVDLEEPS